MILYNTKVLILRKVRHDIQRMVTVEYLENNILEGKSVDELSEEEITELREAFLVVSVDPDFDQQVADLSEKEIEEEKVESSPEFESATDIYNTTFVGLACSFIFGCVFLILLTLKLDNRLDASWWTVFIPIWIERGCRLVSNCYHCICGTVTGDEVVLVTSNLHTEDANSIGKNSIDDKSVDQETQQKEDCKESIDKENDDTVTTIETNIVNAKAEDSNNGDKDNDKCDQNDDSAQLDDNASIKDKTEQDLPADEKTDKGNTCDDHVDIDEEDYYAWQSAYEQAEQDANKEKAQFFSEGCFLIFQIILLCLVVAKIEKNYNKMNPNDTGFNVFWILFPFFLLFGLICCCCTLLIFGAQEHSGEESDEKDYDPENPPLKTQDNPDNEGEIDTAELEENAASDKYCSGETEKMKIEKSELVVELVPVESNIDDLD